MGRRPAHAPLRVYLNNRRVGTLAREASGAISFSYHEDWLAWDHALPVSLSLPLRETPYRGEAVIAVFENLLPDSDKLRRLVAEKVGARGIDAYSMLAKIGHDCVGALQFMAGDGNVIDSTGKLEGEPVDSAEIEKILTGLSQAPLGLARDDAFRISVAGAQEKTALLRHDGKWIKPQPRKGAMFVFVHVSSIKTSRAGSIRGRYLIHWARRRATSGRSRFKPGTLSASPGRTDMAAVLLLEPEPGIGPFGWNAHLSRSFAPVLRTSEFVFQPDLNHQCQDPAYAVDLERHAPSDPPILLD